MSLKKRVNNLAMTWSNHNVYNFQLGDSIAYFVFYIILPICITTVSLVAFPDDEASAAYCYVSIMISALNSIYDNALRWTPKTNPTFKNTKLLCAMIPNGIIAIYCIFEIIACLTAPSMSLRWDYLLFIYAIPTFIMTKDFWECIKKRLVGISCIEEMIEVSP